MAAPKRSTIVLWVIVVLLLIALIALFQDPNKKPAAQDITYTDFLTLEPHIRDVTLRGDQATGHDDRNVAFSVMLPHDPAIATRLAQNHVAVVIAPAEDQNWLTTLLVNGLPLLAYLFLTTWPLFRVSRSLDTLAGRFDRRAEPSTD